MSKIKVILIKIDGEVQQTILDSERPLYHPILVKNRFGESHFGDYGRDEVLSFIGKSNIKSEDIYMSLLVMMFPYEEKDKSEIYKCSICNKEISFADWYECSICTDCLCKKYHKQTKGN